MAWSPWKSWWLDVLKFTVTFTLGAVFSVTILDNIDSKRQRDQFLWRLDWQRNVDVLEEFRVATRLYLEATEAAMAEASRGRSTPGNPVVRSWKGAANDRYELALESLRLRFSNPEVDSLIRELNRIHGALYQEHLELARKTGSGGPYIWSESLNGFAATRLDLIVLMDDLLPQTIRE